ncbi:hypothetical protein JTB14_015603 [Gonioctena quinquepunctata]|nr:hypothetical protein JTB14_015603 [Gonioctena quinquepunctata]
MSGFAVSPYYTKKEPQQREGFKIFLKQAKEVGNKVQIKHNKLYVDKKEYAMKESRQAEDNSTIMHHNMQCIRNKTDYINASIEDYDRNQRNIEVLCITESWANENEVSSLSVNNLVSNYGSRMEIHGGVMIYTGKNLDLVEIENLKVGNIEEEFEYCTAMSKSIKVIVICVYRSPAEQKNHIKDNIITLLNIFNMYLTINTPTRVIQGSASILDNVVTAIDLKLISSIGNAYFGFGETIMDK